MGIDLFPLRPTVVFVLLKFQAAMFPQVILGFSNFPTPLSGPCNVIGH